MDSELELEILQVVKITDKATFPTKALPKRDRVLIRQCLTGGGGVAKSWGLAKSGL